MSNSNSIFWNLEIRNGISYYSEPMGESNNVKQLEHKLAKAEAELKKLKEEKEEAEKSCIICCDKKADTIFLPCGHLVCCEDCQEDMAANVLSDPRRFRYECPVCKEFIYHEKKVYQI